MKFKSSRADGRGHQAPISYDEESKAFSVRVPVSIHGILKGMDTDKVRKHLIRLAKKGK